MIPIALLAMLKAEMSDVVTSSLIDKAVRGHSSRMFNGSNIYSTNTHYLDTLVIAHLV